MTKFFTDNILILAAFFTGCLFLYGCENDIKQVQNLGKKKNSVEEAINVESLMSEKGRMKAKLKAPVMLHYQGDSSKFTFPKSLHVDFYDSTLIIESQLFAKYGQFMENQSKVYLRDSVVVFNIKGDTLFCDDLWWDQNKEIFYTDKKIIIRKPFGEIINGRDGLVAKQDFSKYTIIKPHDSFLNYDDSLASAPK